MKTFALFILAPGISLVTAPAESVGFDSNRVGMTPPGWIATQTGSGAAIWRVELDSSAPSQPNVLKQSGVATYPVCLKADPALTNGFVEVKFKTVSGKEDQAAGLVWRAQDANNYYVARANALEDNVVLYKTERGQRHALDIAGRQGGYGVKQRVTPGGWHTLRVEFANTRFTVSLDTKELFQVEDATFTGAGKVGLWTKADSVTLFDDFRYGTK